MNDPRQVRMHNEGRCLTALYRHGPMSRADLARELDLTRSTLTKITAGLAERGLVRETTRHMPEGRTGRPGTLIALGDVDIRFVGIGLEPGRLTVVGIDLAGKLTSRTVRMLAADVDAEGVAREVERSLTAFGDISGSAVTSAVAVPGILGDDRRILSAPMLGWEDVDLVRPLRQAVPAWGEPILVNDANAAAFAEHWAGDIGDEETVLFVLVESGLGVGLVHQGAIFGGADGYAGEAGHMRTALTPGAPRLEDVISIRALLDSARTDDLSVLMKSLDQGDQTALKAFETWCVALGVGLANMTVLLNPSRVVIGGSAVNLADRENGRIRTACADALRRDYPLPSISFSSLGADAPALGAAYSAQARFLLQPGS